MGSGRPEGATAMELRHLDTLLAIAEQGSFTAAADVLSTVQSNVSEQVRQLEEELGADLLVRGRRGALPAERGAAGPARARRLRRGLGAVPAVPAGRPMPRPPVGARVRGEAAEAAAAGGLSIAAPVEAEGIRLIADMVAAAGGASVLPETASPPELTRVRRVALRDVPPRRLGLITARESYLSLADRAVRDGVRRLVARHRDEQAAAAAAAGAAR